VLSGSSAYWAACLTFVFTLALIVSEKVHKTKAALLGAATTLVLGLLSQEEAFHSVDLGIDHGVIFLLIGMMIIVDILGKSGAFEWSAVRMAKLVGGRPWPIMVVLVLATALFSALLDNVTTVLLFAPVTLLLADELELDPVPFLIAEALASNIGGTATLIGDPPNLMIASRSKLGFVDFIANLGPVVVVMIAALVAALWIFFGRMRVDEERRQHILSMNERKLIRDPSLVRKSVVVLAFVTAGFMLHGVTHIEPAAVALAGAAVLLLISREDPHKVLAAVEWPTIFFFIGLYIVIGGIVKAGLVAQLSAFVIYETGPSLESTATTSFVMLWFSGLLSAFVDNIPYVATMAPLVSDMANSVVGGGTPAAVSTLQHPAILPVWWALALGSCLGGNGSPIGASANVAVLGIAERAGHKISFLRFMAYGMPVLLMTLLIAHLYLWIRFF
jgi:Na+/H+ antiporter NhaD/arsenite permease-like protein